MNRHSSSCTGDFMAFGYGLILISTMDSDNTSRMSPICCECSEWCFFLSVYFLFIKTEEELRNFRLWISL